MTALVLASTSAVRKSLLTNAGLAFTAISPGVDEDAVKASMLAEGATPRAVAEALARTKALAISRGRGGPVIGADQTLEMDGVLYDKVAELEAARERLLQMRGREHFLHAGVALAEGDQVVWAETVTTRLVVRDFSDAFLDGYLARNGAAVLSSVGCYYLEGEGVQLFDAIEGDYFAILGLPMTGLLAQLRARGLVAA